MVRSCPRPCGLLVGSCCLFAFYVTFFTYFASSLLFLQVETARVYQTAGVNPLAGCLPSLATIPVFIGLYK